MNININTLKKQIENIPSPQEEGQRLDLELIDRVQEINLEKALPSSFGDPEEIERRLLPLVAVIYCEHKDKCWLEWEIKI